MIKKIKVLLLSSKYHPEYSGSGLRAHNTYKRLEKKYDINFDVIVNSINYQGNLIYKYKEDNITHIRYHKISQIFNKEGLKTPRGNTLKNNHFTPLIREVRSKKNESIVRISLRMLILS